MGTIQLQDEILSAREYEVLGLLARGRKNHEIAEELGIEECTVRFHVGNILGKLGAKNRTEAVSHAFRNGWMS